MKIVSSYNRYLAASVLLALEECHMVPKAMRLSLWGDSRARTLPCSVFLLAHFKPLHEVIFPVSLFVDTDAAPFFTVALADVLFS